MEGTDDIAILGFSFKLPQDVEDDAGFWEVLHGRKNLMTDWPESRFNASSFVGNSHTKVLIHMSSSVKLCRPSSQPMVDTVPRRTFHQARCRHIRCTILLHHGEGGRVDGPDATLDAGDLVSSL